MIRPNTPSSVLRTIKYCRNASVKLLSIVSTSLVKRCMMRPSGVVSKKDMGARRICHMASLDMVRLAAVPTLVETREKAKRRKP
jgi:hypothetical protein